MPILVFLSEGKMKIWRCAWLSLLLGFCTSACLREVAQLVNPLLELDPTSISDIDSLIFTIESNDMEKSRDGYEITDRETLDKIVQFYRSRPDRWRTLIHEGLMVDSVEVLANGYKDGKIRFGLGVSERLDDHAYIELDAVFIKAGRQSNQARKITLAEQAELMALLGIVERDLRVGDYDVVAPAKCIGKPIEHEPMFIQGRVYAGEEKAPVYQAEIALYLKKKWENYKQGKSKQKPASPRETMTDETGHYSIHYPLIGNRKSNPIPEDFVLVITKEGFAPMEVTLESFSENREIILHK